MQQFKIRPDGFKEIRKKMLARGIPVLLIASTAGILMGLLNSGHKEADTNILPFMIPFMLAVTGLGLYRGIKRQKKIIESYTLSVAADLIRREQFNTPAISIYVADIKEIIKHKNGSLSIKGKGTADLILIPAQIDNPLQLESTLQSFSTITVKEKESLLQKYPSLIGFITIGLMLCVYTLQNKIVVGITGTVLLCLMVWSFLKIQRNKSVDKKTKNGSWLIFLVLLSVIAVMMAKLFGGSTS
jgi:hypothetical protein